MNLKTLFLPVMYAAHNCANQHVVVYRYVRQGSLISESGSFSGMNAFHCPIFGPISVASNSTNEMHQRPTTGTRSLPLILHLIGGSSLPVVKPLSIYSVARSQLATRVQAHLACSLALDKLNWIMSAPLADINFLLLAKLGLPELEEGGRVQPHLRLAFAHLLQWVPKSPVQS